MSMKNLVSLLALLLFASPAWAQEAPSASADSSPPKLTEASRKSLEDDLGGVLRVDAVARSKVGVYAVDLDSGEVLADVRADETFNPASNQKLFTAATALDVLGPGKRFYTKLRGNLKGSTVQGGLYVSAVGDPELHFEDFVKWGTELRQKGVETIDGDIVVDEGAFGSGLPPAFEQKNEDASYRAAIGAFSVSFNGVAVIVEPGAVGGAARVRLDPPNDYVMVDNVASTVSGKSRRVFVSAETAGDQTVIKVSGKIGASASPVVSRKRIESPGLFAGAALEQALAMVGIEVTGEVRLGTTPNNVETLVTHESSSVAHVVYLMNKFSNNFMAEMLFRHVGVSDDGFTEEASAAAYRATAQKHGVDTTAMSVKNGSGLYDGNVVTPRQVVQLLVAMDRATWGPEFASSLSIAGIDGTLSNRLKGSETRETLRGKTGTLNEVTALSGYLRTSSGRRVAYAIIFNDTPVYAWRLRSAQDDIAEVIARFAR